MKYFKQAAEDEWGVTGQGRASGVIRFVGGKNSAANGGLRGKVVTIGDNGDGRTKLKLGHDYLSSSDTDVVPDEEIKLIDSTNPAYDGNHVIAEVLSQASGLAHGTTTADGTVDTIPLVTHEAGNLAGQHIYLNSTDARGQSRLILSYDTNTNVAQVTPAWDVVPMTGTSYLVNSFLEVVVDTPFVGDAEAEEWVDGEALFRLRGGVTAVLEDHSGIPGGLQTKAGVSPSPDYDVVKDIYGSSVDFGRLVDMQPGNYGSGMLSRFSCKRTYDLMADQSPSQADIEFDPDNARATQHGIVTMAGGPTGSPPYRTDVSDWPNYYKFEDCFAVSGSTPC